MTPYDAFFHHNAMKLHFTPTKNYDYIAYHGKTKANDKTFRDRPDKLWFEIISRQRNLTQWIDMLVAVAMMMEHIPHAKRCIDTDIIEAGETWEQRRKNQINVFRRDLQMIKKRHVGDFELLFKMNHRENQPQFLRFYYMRLLPADTLILVDRAFDIFKRWDVMMPEHTLWKKSSFALRKLSPFVVGDADKIMDVFADVFDIDNTNETSHIINRV